MKTADIRSLTKTGIYMVLGREVFYTDIAMNRSKFERFDFARRGLGDSLHPVAAENALKDFRKLVGGRRGFFSTMSTTVIDCFYDFSNAEELSERILFVDNECNIHQMDMYEARLVWSAYEVGIESLSQILLTRGMW